MPLTSPAAASRMLRSSVVAVCVLVLASCGVPHVRTEIPLTDPGYYGRAIIDAVEVVSVEQHPRALELNERWSRLAYGLLAREIGQRYELVERGYGDTSTLVIAVSIHIQYGSRSMRYFVGGGAGAGYVDSVLSAVDAATGQEQLRVTARSELSVGAFGGSMDETVRANVRALIARSGLDQ